MFFKKYIKQKSLNNLRKYKILYGCRSGKHATLQCFDFAIGKVKVCQHRQTFEDAIIQLRGLRFVEVQDRDLLPDVLHERLPQVFHFRLHDLQHGQLGQILEQVPANAALEERMGQRQDLQIIRCRRNAIEQGSQRHVGYQQAPESFGFQRLRWQVHQGRVVEGEVLESPVPGPIEDVDQRVHHVDFRTSY